MADYLEAEEATVILIAAIDGAFATEVDRCFTSLVEGIAAGNGHARCQFTAGVRVAEHAREVALDVVRGR